jgi:hypothetical protein
MIVAKTPKDPDAILDYTLNWSTEWLEGDTISTATWSASTGITVVSSTITGGLTTVWLSGGTAGRQYEVQCRITTAGGRKDDRTLLITCAER